MKIRISHFLIFVSLFIEIHSVRAQSDHVQGEFIIQLIPSEIFVKESFEEMIVDSIGEVHETLTINNFYCLSKHLNIWLIETRYSGDILNYSQELEYLNILNRDPIILSAQFNHYISSRTTPNDPQFSNEWGMNNTGQLGGVSDADIDAPEAWAITTGGLTTGGDTIVVAVIDGGADLTHNDLNFWKNHNETPANAVDDDANGYIDDYDGWDATTHSGTIPSDFHGTHLCGIVGAKGNNNLGVAGVNWNVKIMPLRYGSLTEATAVESYAYVLDQKRDYINSNGAEGAFVVSTNSSFGINNGQPSNFPIWCAMYDSLGAYGILSAGATANANFNIDVTGDMPTACPSDYLITVTNTQMDDTKNSNAGYGVNTIDLGAPGTSIISTTPGNSYGNLTGTSMATPQVAGAVALLYSLPCPGLQTDFENNPAATALLVKQWILQGVDVIPSLNGITVSNGRLNIYKSLLLAAIHYGCDAVVDEISKQEKYISVFPNPSTESIHINTLVKDGMQVKLLIINNLGEIILQSNEKTSGFGVYQKTIDISSFPAGIYHIEFNAGTITTSKDFVKF